MRSPSLLSSIFFSIRIYPIPYNPYPITFRHLTLSRDSTSTSAPANLVDKYTHPTWLHTCTIQKEKEKPHLQNTMLVLSQHFLVLSQRERERERENSILSSPRNFQRTKRNLSIFRVSHGQRESSNDVVFFFVEFERVLLHIQRLARGS